MENIRIGLITKDKEYGRALGLALVDVYRNFTVTLFKSVPVHKELESLDLVLSDTRDDYEIRGKQILLTEKNSQVDRNYDDKYFCLYKYSNVRQLAGELLFIYSELTGRKAVPMRNVNAKITVFGASEGGCGCTSSAITYAREYRRSNEKKVMYLSLEELESTPNYMKSFTEGRNISDYLYYLLNSRKDNKFPFIESYVLVDPFGVEAFAPSPGRNVMKSLSPEEMQYFIGSVLDTGGYDMIVIDAGCSLEKSILTCYEMANEIYMISREDMSGKEERFMEYLLFAKGEKVADRVDHIKIPYDPDSFMLNEGVVTIKPEGALGMCIKEIVRP